MVDLPLFSNAASGVVPTHPMLEVRDLTFGYPGQTLLEDVQLSVQSGEMIGLLGPNGSGKTTLLRLVAGLLHPQKGQILLDGRALADWGRRRVAQRLAVVPQEFQVPFAFTVEQMVALGRTPFISLFGSRTDRDREIVRTAMRQAEVDVLAERIFNEMSGGERQRVLLAMALAQQPHLLLLDEPTSHLDIKYQLEMLDLLKRFNRETGVTVLAAMHDLNLAARYFPRLVLFQRGIVADGGPAEVLEPELLRRVYGIAVQVGVMLGAEHLSVLPPGESVLAREKGKQAQPQVHVMAGGGSGARTMRALADAGIAFSAGVLPVGDSDHALAEHLADEVITEQPFSSISENALKRLRERLAEISLLIICPMPVGEGNLILLQEALLVCQRGVEVLLYQVPDGGGEGSVDLSVERLLRRSGIDKRDYAYGEGARLYRRLLEVGAGAVTSVSEVVELAGDASRK